MTLEIQVLDWNRDNNVAELNWLMGYHPLHLLCFPNYVLIANSHVC